MDEVADRERWVTITFAIVGLDGIDNVARGAVFDFLAEQWSWRGAARPDDFGRTPAALLALLSRLPADRRAAAAAALPERRLSAWLRSLRWLRSRLPPNIDPGVLSALVDATAAASETSFRVCDTCGLRRPDGNRCPHCADVDWGWESDAGPEPWRELAAKELA